MKKWKSIDTQKLAALVNSEIYTVDRVMIQQNTLKKYDYNNEQLCNIAVITFYSGFTWHQIYKLACMKKAFKIEDGIHIQTPLILIWEMQTDQSYDDILIYRELKQ